MSFDVLSEDNEHTHEDGISSCHDCSSPKQRLAEVLFGLQQGHGLHARAHWAGSVASVLLVFCAVYPGTAGPGREGESPEETLQRRLKESERVEERVTYVDSEAELEAELQRAGSKLVVLEASMRRERTTADFPLLLAPTNTVSFPSWSSSFLML